MPANLTPDYLAAEARFRGAVTTEDKLAALDEMYATIPKHKGTEKLRADIKRRMSKLREKEKQAGPKSKRFNEFHIEKQGAGQVILLGPANAGRSTLVSALTSAQPEIADYPYTTRAPLPGMMDYEDISVQIVDTPAIFNEHTDGGLLSMARVADSVALVVDVSDNGFLDQLEDIRDQALRSKLMLVGKGCDASAHSAGVIYMPTFIIANKIDKPDIEDNIEALREMYASEYDIYLTSARLGEGLEDLRRGMFDSLEIIRVYTKMPGKPADRDKPFTLKKGSTLMDFAATVHKDFVSRLRFARAWGSNHLEGAKIGRDYILQDGDIVEMHE